MSVPEEIRTAADAVANARNADIFIYNGPVSRLGERLLLNIIETMPMRRENAALILVTKGGQAKPAYRMARRLQACYKKFFAIISGECASAGTLLVLGAHELIVGPDGELGPVDVQLSKRDELWESSSGLLTQHSLESLSRISFTTFSSFLVNIKVSSRNTVTLRTAMDIAVKLTTGLLSPVYSHIDPLKLGEDSRAMLVAREYGERLAETSGNTLNDSEQGTILQLLAGYSSHDFVIDRREIEGLFKNVRELLPSERDLIDRLGALALEEQVNEDSQDLVQPLIALLSTPVKDTTHANTTERRNETEPIEGEGIQEPTGTSGETVTDSGDTLSVETLAANGHRG